MRNQILGVLLLAVILIGCKDQVTEPRKDNLFKQSLIGVWNHPYGQVEFRQDGSFLKKDTLIFEWATVNADTLSITYYGKYDGSDGIIQLSDMHFIYTTSSKKPRGFSGALSSIEAKTENDTLSLTFVDIYDKASGDKNQLDGLWKTKNWKFISSNDSYIMSYEGDCTIDLELNGDSTTFKKTTTYSASKYPYSSSTEGKYYLTNGSIKFGIDDDSKSLILNSGKLFIYNIGITKYSKY